MVALHGRHPRRRGGRGHIHHSAAGRMGRFGSRLSVQRSADRMPQVPQAPAFRQAGGVLRRKARRQAARERSQGHRLPRVRHPRRVDRTARLQHDAAHPPRAGRGREQPALPAPRDRAGHLRRLQERDDLLAFQAAVRHRQHGQVLPQRDHARQLHLPHP